mmetsp:Transcript_36011/g.80148  ORF Transcript_36011/g.80148 Transcript_36011/m.80148 type:complete len:1160 (+) Transcript_36011:163-3642(+)|eukprot:CAMPEP_0202903896 /NCGR_PEP_ID=MMETSP1392-20130828/26944_1 /ASSEMBLY_ACC=CAM_ASM_000868 /TAXON_ID=225041 /ORGANISM="Chlamydomonas chlamydogama, Strain SAG 11-48b" /LENGTH=1159 /DNA_ID=CAMNT_0049591259 /DNA_START=78 /DNA_END=3557 /DNA_ORIENTATION=+
MKRTREDGAQSTGPAGKRPTGTQRPPNNPSSQSKLTTNDALSYLREVKNRFSDQKDVYDTFLEIMKEFKAQRIDTAGVISRVKKLFKGHRELILGFNTFLPKGYEIELARISDDEEEEEAPAAAQIPSGTKQPVEFDQAISYVNKIKTRFNNDERVYKAFLEILNLYRKGQKNITNVYQEVAVLFRHHQDLLDEFTYFLPDTSQGKEASRRAGAGAYRAGAKPPSGRGPPPPGSPSDLRHMHKRKAAKKAEEGFRAGYGYAEEPRRPNLARELQFFEKVKARLRNRDAYNDLLKCLNMYSQEIISRAELVWLVNDIVGKHPDLVTGFSDFLDKCEMMDVDVGMAIPRAPGGPPVGASRDMLRQKQLQKDKFLTKPLSEVVAGEQERITPSYVKMPVGYPKLLCSGRTDLGNGVLNDSYVNVITGSEDYSFKLMRKNQYEEALFRCEDDRYEFEMCIETNASTLKSLRPLAERLAGMTPEERSSFRLEDGMLSPVHFRSIERLYGDQGPMLLDLLRRNPGVAIPVVMARLEQKDQEWRKVKEEMTRTWKKIYEQNYHKSLDHRSFYFKQAEKKCLLPRTMVTEVKEAADRRKADEQYLRCLSLAHRYDSGASTAVADLQYDYGEKLVFQDCWTIMRVAIQEALASGPREQVMELYLSNVEPFFGLPERADELAKLKVDHSTPAPGAETEMPDAKSDSDEQEADNGAAEGGDEEGKAAAGKTPTPGPEGTPEPMAAEGGPGHRAAAEAPGEPEPGTVSERPDEEAAADIAGLAAAAAARAEDSTGDTRGAAAGGGEGSDEHMAHSYAGCRPLAPWTGPASTSEGGAAPGSSRLMFANELIYIFFRFHRFLYDRLWTARKCALQQALQRNQQAYRGTVSTPLADANAGENGENATPTPEPQAQAREEADRMHAQFMSMAIQVLAGELEISVFEDQVRTLLGTNSYELFTLDKLLHKLLNHMRLMTQDEQSMRLWELYKYEHMRSIPVHATAFHINSHTILDDTCYRIEFKDSSNELTVQLMEPDKTDVFGATEGYLTEYIRGYVSALTPAQSAEHKLYLQRNLVQRARQYADEAVVDALKNVRIYNGLECKISCTNSKVSYVLDTEDVMWRQRHQRSSKSQDERVERFKNWLHDTAKRLQEEEGVASVVQALAAGPETMVAA